MDLLPALHTVKEKSGMKMVPQRYHFHVPRTSFEQISIEMMKCFSLVNLSCDL